MQMTRPRRDRPRRTWIRTWVAVACCAVTAAAHAGLECNQYLDEGDPSKAAYKRAKLVVTGVATKSVPTREGEVRLRHTTAKGRWQLVTYRVDGVIKGAQPGKELKIRVFRPSDPYLLMYVHQIPVGVRTVVFLTPERGAGGAYTVVQYDAPFMWLAAQRPAIPDALPPLDKLAAEWRAAVLADDSEVAVHAMDALRLFERTGPDTLSVLKKASNARDPRTAAKAIATRLALRDWSALDDFIKAWKGKAYPTGSLAGAGSALRLVDDPACISALETLMGHPTAYVRNGAAYALREMHLPQLVPLYITFLNDSDRSVQLNGLVVLCDMLNSGKIKQKPDYAPGADHAALVKAWKQWWAEKGRYLFPEDEGGPGP